MLSTIDGGAHWKRRASGTKKDLESVSFVDSSHGCVVGGLGLVLTTNDGGAHWKLRASGTARYLNSVSFVDSSHGWAAGDMGIMLATTDGGAHWKVQASGTKERLLSVSFADSAHGWVVDYNNTIRATTDGGAHWKRKSSGADVYSVCAVDSLDAWAVGDAVQSSILTHLHPTRDEADALWTQKRPCARHLSAHRCNHPVLGAGHRQDHLQALLLKGMETGGHHQVRDDIGRRIRLQLPTASQGEMARLCELFGSDPIRGRSTGPLRRSVGASQ